MDQITTIAAIVAGPILALLAQRILDHLRENKKRKLTLFHGLLTSRAIPLSMQHVQGLNSIELEFYPRRGKNKRVLDAWRIYSDHLNQPQSGEPAAMTAWETRRLDLIVDLLYEMSQALGYDFDKVMLKRNAYYPTGLGTAESEVNALRTAALAVFQGRSMLRVTNEPPSPLPAPLPATQAPTASPSRLGKASGRKNLILCYARFVVIRNYRRPLST